MSTPSLTMRRTFPASQARVFSAWTTPALLMKWWGPKDVVCPLAEVDLRVGGAYCIGNRLPDGKEIWIRGVFETVDAPARLVYTWSTDESRPDLERVTVEFVAVDDNTTEVVLFHERLADERIKEQHASGWTGCLDGLQRLLSAE